VQPKNSFLSLPGRNQPSYQLLAKDLLTEARTNHPRRHLILIGDGAYAAKSLLDELDSQVSYVGRLRGDAALYEVQPPPERLGRRGRKPQRGRRLPSPKEAADRADANRPGRGTWIWRSEHVQVYGLRRTFRVLEYEAAWPKVLGWRTIRIVVVRDPAFPTQDAYLFSTDLETNSREIVETFARRWSIVSIHGADSSHAS
jgi:hypothetical protein